MKRISPIAIAATVLFCFALSTTAHPGHSLGEHGPLHVVTSPYHLAILALAGSALLLASRFVQSRLPRCLLQGAGIVALLIVALIWGSN